MCNSSAYILKEGKEELILKDVDSLECDENQVTLVDIFGDKKTLDARVKSFSLVDHKILLEPV